MDFVHLHDHTEYSLADATAKTKEIPKRIKELGMKAFAKTDHGNMFDDAAFYKECKAEGIKPIMGMEAYVAPRLNTQKEANIDNANYHLVLLCENNEGYYNLMQISSDSSINGFYYKPRTDKSMLKKYAKGLIALSACIGGEVQQYILDNKYDEAKKSALEYNEIFGQGNFYLELQDHKMPEQAKINVQLIRMSRETGIPLVCTNDCHYIYKEGYKAHDVLMAIQAGTTVDDTKRKKYPNDEFYIKSPSEMYAIFGYIPEAIENTVKIADRCNVEFEFGKNKIPPFSIPKWFEGNNLDFLKKLCYEGAERLYGKVSQEIIDRTEYEISVANNMGYVNYFLIVWDFFRFCIEGTMEYGMGIKEGWEKILTGPGRGSGAGSIMLYELGITKIDPLRYDLLFERFLDPSRISMPDIDSDFAYDRRQEVIDYVVEKYGRNSVSQIITFGTMAARAVIRRVGKAINLPYSFYDGLAKMVPTEPGITLTKALKVNADFRIRYETDVNVKALIDTCIQLEGLPLYTGTHAAGVLITDQKGVTNYVPVWNNDGAIVSQSTMGLLEEQGLLKMDFLGLRTLTVMNDTVKAVKKNYGIDLDLDEMYECKDLKPLKLIQDGITTGIFQLEGAGMTSFMKELKPRTWEEVIAGISLYRPGPMQYIPKFIENRRNSENIQYRFEELKPILSETYGILTYQEQIMKAVILVAGYQKSDSDGFRKIISKKKKAELPLQKKWFIYGRGEEDDDGHGHIKKYSPIPGGIKHRGHSVKDLEEMFSEMEDFASYCFNKSHAAAYMVVGAVTATLLYYYPTEFMAALMTSVKGDLKKIGVYIKACIDMGIEILPPDINAGNDSFVALPGKKVVYTLSAKNTNANALEGIVEVRKDTKYTNFLYFLKKNAATINKPTVESLVCIGALDSLGIVRSQILAALDDIFDDRLKKAKDKQKRNVLAWQKYYEWIESSCYNCPKGNLSSAKRNEACLGCPFPNVSKAKQPPELQLDFAIDDVIPQINEFPKDIILKLERKYLGIYLSGHPLHKYGFAIKNMGKFKSSDMNYDINEETGAIVPTSPIYNGQKVKFIAILNSIRKTATKAKGDQMAFVEFEDSYGACSAVVFPRQYDKVKGFLKEDEIYAIMGSIQIKDDDAPSIIVEDMKPIKEQVVDRVVIKAATLYESYHLMELLKQNSRIKGFNPVYVEYENVRVLLNSNYWVNLEEIDDVLNNYKYEILNW